MSARGQLARCALHGLHFDVSQSSGCVLCRRLSAPPGAGARTTCRGGTAEDCSRYAAIYGRPESLDLTLRAELTQEGCNKGSAVACARLSEMLAEGRGLPRDPARALELRDQGMAAALGALKECKEPECQLSQLGYDAGGNLMEQYRRAEVAPDVVARECDAGKLGACQPNRDLVAANRYFARAIPMATTRCEAGDAGACHVLSPAYRRGQGVARDEKKSEEYLLKVVEASLQK